MDLLFIFSLVKYVIVERGENEFGENEFEKTERMTEKNSFHSQLTGSVDNSKANLNGVHAFVKRGCVNRGVK